MWFKCLDWNPSACVCVIWSSSCDWGEKAISFSRVCVCVIITSFWKRAPDGLITRVHYKLSRQITQQPIKMQKEGMEFTRFSLSLSLSQFVRPRSWSLQRDVCFCVCVCVFSFQWEAQHYCEVSDPNVMNIHERVQSVSWWPVIVSSLSACVSFLWHWFGEAWFVIMLFDAMRLQLWDA